MTDPVPSKDLVTELRATNNRPEFAQIYLRHLAQRAADEIESLQRQVEALSIHAAKWVTRALELQTNLARVTGEREPPHCSTCGCGLAPEPAVTPSERLRRIAFDLSDLAINPPRELNRTELAKIAARMLSASAHVELGERTAQPPGDGEG